MRKSILAIFLLNCFAIFPAGIALSQENPVMKAYQQIIPRGRIAAITEPMYVPAEVAKISDDSWVLGVLIDGEARAYSLNLLNSHEIVNDKIGNTAFAAVW